MSSMPGDELGYEVLDHGYIQLVTSMGSDEKVVEDARMSIQGDGVEANKGPSSKLIDYLMRNKHTTPFEGCTVTFEVQAPIFVARQWMRHRTQSYNEMSARYGEVPSFWYQPDAFKAQADKNKQCSGGPLNDNMQPFCHDIYNTTACMAYDAYKALLAQGVSREQARAILPQAMYTKFRTTGNLWNFMHFMNLRSHPHAQEEIRVYSNAMGHILDVLFPISMQAWRKHHVER